MAHKPIETRPYTTATVEAFAEAYVRNLGNATAAYYEAVDPGADKRTANRVGPLLVKRPDFQAAILALQLHPEPDDDEVWLLETCKEELRKDGQKPADRLKLIQTIAKLQDSIKARGADGSGGADELRAFLASVGL